MGNPEDYEAPIDNQKHKQELLDLRTRLSKKKRKAKKVK